MAAMLGRKAAATAEAFSLIKSSARRKAAYAALYHAAKENPEKFRDYGDRAMGPGERSAYDAMWLRLTKEGFM